MKKLNKLKLNAISDEHLSGREMKNVMGGMIPVSCGCGCHYAGSGGSSTVDNCKANYSGGSSGGLYSPGGTSYTCSGYSY